MKSQGAKLLITRSQKCVLGSGHRLRSPEQLHRPIMLKNVETAKSENNYKIILSEAANSQKRALLKTIVGIMVGIVLFLTLYFHINQ